MADSNIQSVLQEERSFTPPAPFAKRARPTAAELEALHAQAEADPNGFWADLARRELHWETPFTVTLDDSKAPNYRWFTDGRLNVAWNCLDVHLTERGHKTAIVFEGEPGDTRRLSYRELHAEVCRFANALSARGVKSGDRVVIYMPLVPEIVIAMFACVMHEFHERRDFFGRRDSDGIGQRNGAHTELARVGWGFQALARRIQFRMIGA